MRTSKALVPAFLADLEVLRVNIIVEAAITDMELVGRHSDNGSFSISAYNCNLKYPNRRFFVAHIFSDADIPYTSCSSLIL
jgi:hypothetical protein